MNFKGKKVLILGLGSLGGGVNIAKWLIKQKAYLRITDLKSESELKNSIKKLKKFKNIKFILGKHRKQDIKWAEIIIKNPAVKDNSPYILYAKNLNKKILTDISIFFSMFKGTTIGITGTKGKSTTTYLIYKILKNKFGNNVGYGGNIRKPILSCLNKKIAVLELSSWQLRGLKLIKKSPNISILTNIFEDHLNYYKNFLEYAKDKFLIFKFQKNDDIAILNKKNFLYFKKQNLKIKSKIIFLKSKNDNKKEIAQIIANIFKISKQEITKTLKNFNGLPYRLEFLKEFKKRLFFDDTTSTIPQSTIKAISELTQKYKKCKLIILLGGVDKNLNYENLTKLINKNSNIKGVLLFKGTASDKMLKTLNPSKIIAKNLESMTNAVRIAFKNSNPKDIIILSPSAASFNLFKNEFDRGKKFREAIRKLIYAQKRKKTQKR